MLCANCHKNEATVHFTYTVEGTEQETIDLCQECAPPMDGLESFEPQDLEALSASGKKCEFCGKDALLGGTVAAGAVTYRCSDCDVEYGRILTDLFVSERPDLVQRVKDGGSYFAWASDPDFKAWSAAAHERAVRILKDRRKQHGGDKTT